MDKFRFPTPAAKIPSNKFRFAIDRGGTFTDIFAICPGGKIKTMKLLSEDPRNYDDAPREGIRRIISEETRTEMAPGHKINTNDIDWIRMGTTVATNALLERTGERLALVVTKGFKDALFIGNQSRPEIFSLEINCPDVLYEEVIEVEERIILWQDKCEIIKECKIDQSLTGEKVKIWTPLNIEKLSDDLERVYRKGFRSLSVVFLHSYLYPDHELKAEKIAKTIGFSQVSLSSKVMPMVKMVPRGHTACVDAYLTPCIERYIKTFKSGFTSELQGANVLFMQSDGGLTNMATFCGSRAILSGPAGGVIGYSKTAYEKFQQPIIGFDMGGTSTDVSRFDGHFEHVFDSHIAGVSIQAPQLNIITVAAGGGSRLFFRSGLLVVGPESAGAHPGPVCYRKGGPLTITDANLCLGRLQPHFFPKIFGESQNMPLDKEETMKEFEKILKQVNTYIETHPKSNKKTLTVEELASGFIAVANEAMCRPIRALTEGKGFNSASHILACFGGAGSQHACSIAKALGISTIFIHRYSGILSAFGMALANVTHEEQESCALEYCDGAFEHIDNRIFHLSQKCAKKLETQGFNSGQVIFETFLNLRFEKTDCALMVMAPSSFSPVTCSAGDFLNSFMLRYKREFGIIPEDRPVIVDDIRVRGIGCYHLNLIEDIPKAVTTSVYAESVKCFFDGQYFDTAVIRLEHLKYGHEVMGPALIIDANCTIVIEPNCLASVTVDGNIIIKVSNFEVEKISTDLDMIQLSVFSHRFMSIAEQMGKVLQKTSVSTNIKERLDFSCALFGPDGGLVSNAPHIPVHLGSMQEAVQYQLRYLGDDIREGDVILSNHPCAGGSHLPDLTVITPVFKPDIRKPIFFVASRGHHADIGGLTPGSMPPDSTTLLHEGATFKTFKLIKAGIFQGEDLVKALKAPGDLPGCAGSRNVSDNISDLKAQVAANRKGILLVHELIQTYGLDVIQAYMSYIQKNAELAVRDLLKTVGRKQIEKNSDTVLEASDFMDDGTTIFLKVSIDVEQGSAVFDFTGTGHEVYGNCNTPTAVTLSAIIYCLRCMVGMDIPLNQGCLSPITVIIPKNSILSPSEMAAVVGGNVLTSQRIVDVIFKAFGACAASQGCMNNITFGDDSLGYYETVAGGAGAGPHWHGRSGVHTHMTNTRLTDPEILEKRYPVIVKKFELNPGSGGRGLFCGGDGVIRELLFRRNLTLSVLTERRVFAPYGLNGGEDGKRGQNLLCFKNGRIVNLGSKKCVDVSAGDVFILKTPGGGGYGTPSS